MIPTISLQEIEMDSTGQRCLCIHLRKVLGPLGSAGRLAVLAGKTIRTQG